MIANHPEWRDMLHEFQEVSKEGQNVIKEDISSVVNDFINKNGIK